MHNAPQSWGDRVLLHSYCWPCSVHGGLYMWMKVSKGTLWPEKNCRMSIKVAQSPINCPIWSHWLWRPTRKGSLLQILNINAILKTFPEALLKLLAFWNKYLKVIFSIIAWWNKAQCESFKRINISIAGDRTRAFAVTAAQTHSPGHGTANQCSEPSLIPLSYPGA